MDKQGGNGVRQRASDALSLIVRSIKGHPTTGQTKVLVAFIAGVYNGCDYPFDLTEFRSLDPCLVEACLDVLAYNCVRSEGEIHEWGVFNDQQLRRWIEREGIRGIVS